MTHKDWAGNSNSVFKTLGASNHCETEREQDDFYATDPAAIDKLLTVETPHRVVWECACGAGHLSRRLTEHGYEVHSTDIKNRGYEGQDGIMDFLAQSNAPIQSDFDIVTNPPYKQAKEFVLKALDVLSPGRCCYMFLKLTFLEGKSRYSEIFKHTPPRCVYVFSERILCAPNGDFASMRGSAVAYAWFVWEKGFAGKTTIAWI